MIQSHAGAASRAERLFEVVRHAAHLLPAQGPIGVFIHHNTLHAFQHLPFEKAVAEAAAIFGTEPYMPEESYREELKRGRILIQDIEAVLESEPDAPIFDWTTRRALRRAMLHPGFQPLDPRTVQWEIEAGDLLQSEKDRDLFAICLRRTPEPVPFFEPRRFRRMAGDAVDEIVHPMLIRLCGAFLDQGLAYWPMPQRERGFYEAVRTLWSEPGAIPPVGLEGAGDEFRRQQREGMSAVEVVLYWLDQFRIPPQQYQDVLTAELLALPGWAGMFHRLEEEPELAAHEQVPCRVIDFLAVRLTFTGVCTVAHTCGLKTASETHGNDRLFRAARLFQVLKATAVDNVMLLRASEAAVGSLHREIAEFDDTERRRIWHLAYERRHERMILGPLSVHRKTSPPQPWTRRPEAQVFFCLDEREESIRRHLEEIAPDYETLSAAGFYGIAVDYAGIDDAHGVPLCPVVMKPQHAIREKAIEEHSHLYERRRAMRAAWARIVRWLTVSSRSLVRGTFSTGILGLFSLFPLIAHVLTPRQYNRLARALNRWILPEPRTELTLMRHDQHGHGVAEHLLIGFTIPEKTDRVASVLAPAGLYTRFANIVVVLGHGSTSLNNPHESAHDCGACGGRRGGPNARLFAAMANHPAVRQSLGERGILIPDDTWFVGGYHDTCSDEIEYFDDELIPEPLRNHFEELRSTLERARALDAHERSRRFEAAPPDATAEQALWHVQERSEHLAEPRPEYGHCTNAVCIVGRREVTRGLYFDRRAFLVSYDPALDREGESLARLLGAAVPVCAGISLEYYFSFVDNEGYGCGTKLPHNITGLIGVMNGAGSDLRTGLPWQMVEIHEPVRILFNIETKPEILMRIVKASPLLTEFIENGWVRISTLDPDDGSVCVYRNGVFEPAAPWTAEVPEVSSSIDWYRGKLEHLPIARIRRAGNAEHAHA